jgi:hypothetical protein
MLRVYKKARCDVVAKEGLLYFILLCYMRNGMHSPTIKTNIVYITNTEHFEHLKNISLSFRYVTEGTKV